MPLTLVWSYNHSIMNYEVYLISDIDNDVPKADMRQFVASKSNHCVGIYSQK